MTQYNQFKRIPKAEYSCKVLMESINELTNLIIKEYLKGNPMGIYQAVLMEEDNNYLLKVSVKT